MVLKRPRTAAQRDGVRDPEYRLSERERQIWSASLAGAGMAAPILLRPLMMMQPYKSKVADVSAIDERWRVALGDKFFEYPQHEREAIVVHECLHATCNHFQRAKKAGFSDQDMVNVAEDLEINQMIVDLQRVRLPDGALMPKAKGIDSRFGLVDVPAGKSMEEYYSLFSGGKADCPRKKDGPGGGDSGDDAEDQIGPPPEGMDGGLDDLLASMTQQSSGDGDPSDGSGSGGSSGDDGAGEPGSSSPAASGGDDSPDSDGQNGSGASGSTRADDGSSAARDASRGDHAGSGSPSADGSGPRADGDAAGGHGAQPMDRGAGEPGGPSSTAGPQGQQGKQDSVEPTGDGSGDRHGSGNEPGRSDSEKTNAERGRDLCGNSDMDKIRREADEAGVRGLADDQRAEAMRDMAAESNKRLRMNGKAGVSTMDREFLVKFDALVTPPSIPWRRLLQTAMSEYVSKMAYAKTEYSFKRVNRRASSYMRDTVFPSMVGYAPIVMMGIDTSGSRVGNGQFELDARNAEAILKAVGKLSKNSFSVFSVDTDIKKTHLVNRVEDINFTGGGGTDMSVAFDFVRSLPRRKRPDIFILATDGGFDWEKCARVWPKNMKVIILLTDHYYVSRVPAWVYSNAKVIEVTPDM